MPIVKVTNRSTANIPGGKPTITYHDVSNNEAQLMLFQVGQCWATHDVCIVQKVGD